MSKPQYLVHHTNGTIFGYSPILAARADMIAAMDIEEARSLAAKRGNTSAANPSKSNTPTSTGSNVETNDDPPAYDADGNFIISNVSKAELIEFAQEQFDTRLSSEDSIDDLRHQVAELASADQNAGDQSPNPSDNNAPANSGDAPLDVENATKDELEAYAKSQFDVDLDKRKRVDDLRQQVRDLIQNDAGEQSA